MIICGDSFEILKTLDPESVHTCVTSPPYWGLRDYGVEGQLGLEATPEEYVANLVRIFAEVKRVLRDDGTLWLNLGDSYTSGGRSSRDHDKKLSARHLSVRATTPTGLKPKDLIGIPWRVAFALQADGWYLRQDIIWAKPNPMPESVRDRCTKAHEYIFLLSKSKKYYFDHEAIKEPAVSNGVPNSPQSIKSPYGQGFTRRAGSGNKERKQRPSQETLNRGNQAGSIPWDLAPTRNKRSVWTVTTKPFKEAHFATFPPDLIEPCILAGSPKGGVVLDPFFGAGTTGVVAKKHGRKIIGIELNAAYAEIARLRISNS